MTKKTLYAPPCFSADHYRRKPENKAFSDEKPTEKNSIKTFENYSFEKQQEENKIIHAMEKDCSDFKNNDKACMPFFILALFLLIQNQGAV